MINYMLVWFAEIFIILLLYISTKKERPHGT